ncbi:hypothetical protein PSPO01_12729 [Paraphaeosphaeria sporulosa]
MQRTAHAAGYSMYMSVCGDGVIDRAYRHARVGRSSDPPELPRALVCTETVGQLHAPPWRYRLLQTTITGNQGELAVCSSTCSACAPTSRRTLASAPPGRPICRANNRHPQLPKAEHTRQSGPATGDLGVEHRAEEQQRRTVAARQCQAHLYYGAASADDPRSACGLVQQRRRPHAASSDGLRVRRYLVIYQHHHATVNCSGLITITFADRRKDQAKLTKSHPRRSLAISRRESRLPHPLGSGGGWCARYRRVWLEAHHSKSGRAEVLQKPRSLTICAIEAPMSR